MLANVFFQNVIRHHKAFIRREKLLLFKIETVLAVEIANRPDRLGHDMKSAQVWNFASFVRGCCVHTSTKFGSMVDGTAQIVRDIPSPFAIVYAINDRVKICAYHMTRLRCSRKHDISIKLVM